MNKEQQLDLEVAEKAFFWGEILAFEDHHESVFEDILGKFEHDEYLLRLKRGQDTFNEIWEAGKKYLEMQEQALQITQAYESMDVELAVAYERLKELFD
tara:strand:- start:3845 stop:4141 length:297 start_codon:yes stop_codon:yes gene_type:complete